MSINKKKKEAIQELFDKIENEGDIGYAFGKYGMKNYLSKIADLELTHKAEIFVTAYEQLKSYLEKLKEEYDIEE